MRVALILPPGVFDSVLTASDGVAYLEAERMVMQELEPRSWAGRRLSFGDPEAEAQIFELPMTLDELQRKQAEHQSHFRVRRLLDIATALALLSVAWPIMLLASIAVKADSPGPALFGHWRIGKDDKPFRCWKFRSMHGDAQERLHELLSTDAEVRSEWARTQKLMTDPRVTRLGQFLRRSKLDELPQLFNVLRGEMSIIGPRPITDEERPRYGNALPHVLTVLPGITGVWQVSDTHDVTYSERVMLDVHSASHLSMRRDMRVIGLTICKMLRPSAFTALPTTEFRS